MQATLYKANGDVAYITPKDGKEFSLEELQEYVGGMIEMVPLPSGRIFVGNETGRLDNLPVNEKAHVEWRKEYPIEQYPENNPDTLHGDIIISDPKLVGWE